MRKLIIVAALVACCMAAPQSGIDSNEDIYSVPLQRPSPINPDVLGDPKPKETLVKITDPKEAAKYKRETPAESGVQSAPLLPTVLPDTHSDESKSQESAEVHDNAGTEAGVTLNRQKREEKVAVEQKPAQADTKKAVKKEKPETHKHTRRDTDDNAGKPTTAGKTTLPAPEAVKQRRRRDTDASSTVAPVPLIHRDEHKVSQQSSSLEHEVPLHDTENHHHQLAQQEQDKVDGKVQDIAVQLPTSRPVKRDIPVPLVPKYHHPEESPKSDEKKDAENHKKDDKEKGDKSKTESAEENQTHKRKADDKQSAESKEHSGEHTPVHHALHPTQTHHPQDFQTQQAHVAQTSTVEEHNEAASGTSATSTEHPVLRHKPVPVAELFSRPRQ